MRRRATVAIAVSGLLLAVAAPALPASAADVPGTIAYVSDATGDDEVMIMSVDGTQHRRLTENAGPDRAPSWSPDGRSLVFNSRREPHAGRPQLYVVDIATGATTRVTQSTSEDQRAAWSADGATLYLQRGVFFAQPYNLIAHTIDGGSEVALTDSVASHIWNAAPAPSPDGSVLLFQSNRDLPTTDLFPQELFALDLGTGAVAPVTLGGDLPPGSSIDGPTWNPSGTQFAFASDGVLYVVDATGDPATWSATAVTDGSGDDSSPSFSPDGSRLVHQSWVAGDDPDGDEDVAVIRILDLATGEQTTIAEGRTPKWGAATWFAVAEGPQLAATGADAPSPLVAVALAAAGGLAMLVARRLPDRSGRAPRLRRQHTGRR